MSIDGATSQTQSLSLVNIKPDPDGEKPKILKQAITSISGKPNLLKLLNNYKRSSNKSEVFKTIGNRIVIPMKVSVSTKKLAEIESGGSMKTNHYQPSTFQMALSPKQHQNNTSPGSPGNHTVAKISPLCALQHHKERENFLQPSATVLSKFAFKSTTDLKSSFSSTTSFHNGDLRPFGTSVSLDPSSYNDDQESIMSSIDSFKLNTSMNSSKMSDFDEQFDEDDDLTCLSWLSSNNQKLTDTIRRCNPDDPGIGMSGDEMENDENHPNNKSIFLATSPINRQNAAPSQITNDVAYNPMNKPPYSFSCLIFMAIEDSYLKRLPVKDIYTWVCRHFPYFQTAPSGWKNSIRHNLSLNRCFKKAECRKDSAKGSLWCIDPAYRPNLVQALKRSPFYPYLHPTGIGQPLSLNNLANLLPGTQTGRVPSWSPALPPATLWADPDMASAALNLMGLRGNENVSSKNSESISNTIEEIFRDAKWMADPDNKFLQNNDSNDTMGTEPVVICGSQQDHLYTRLPPVKKKVKREDTRCRSPDSDKSAPDAAYEFETVGFSGDELENGILREIADEIVVDESDAEAQRLFDSGFGSLKKFDVKKERNKRKAEKTRPRASSRTKKPKNSIKKMTKSKVNSTKTQTQPSRKQTWKARRRMKVRINSQLATKRNKETKQREKKNSDVDSGKDSPKVDRYSRSKRLKQRSYRKENTSEYHTRSSSHKLLGQDNQEKKRLMSSRRRKRLMSNRTETTDEEEEIKRAAGSLLRLFQSSICSSKVATN